MILSQLFASVQKVLQTSIFILNCCRLCSPVFIWVGARLVSTVIRRFQEPKCVLGYAQRPSLSLQWLLSLLALFGLACLLGVL
jgi:hypothetical protein